MVTGGPGSGKTVVSIYRFIRIMNNDQNGMFFTFNRTLMSSVRGTFRQSARIVFPDLTESQLSDMVNNKVASFFEWYGGNFHMPLSSAHSSDIERNFSRYINNRKDGKRFKEIVIDESQDLHPNIISNAYLLADIVSCGADRSQDLQGHYAPDPADDIIFDLLPNDANREELARNFRNTKEIFAFARQFVPEDINVQDIDIEELPEGELPNVRSGLSFDEQNNLIKEIIEVNPALNIGILVHFQSQIKGLKEFLEVNGFSCAADAPETSSFSYYYNGMPPDDRTIMENRLRTPFILTFDSCKGLEFDIVIIPYFEKANWALNNQRQAKDDLGNWQFVYNADGSPKMWASANHYYVAATRARRELYILCDEKPAVLDFHDDQSWDLFQNELPF
jgi:superfamily I DNA/RNA helicase